MEEKVPNGIWQACRKLMIASFIALVVVIAVAFLLLPFARFMSFETIEVIRKTFEWYLHDSVRRVGFKPEGSYPLGGQR